MRPGMSNDNKDRELAFWCMSAGVAMQELRRLGVRNILLASGTLSPLAHTAYEFQTEFPVRLENPHIVAPQQLWVGAMARGVTNIALNSSYRNRDSVAYKRELGSTLVNFCRMVPAGLLVFFPSYTLLTACVAFWKSPESSSSGGATAATTVWDRVCKYKHAVVEPRENAQFAAALAEYRNRVSDPSRQGAVFFAVCRGKVRTELSRMRTFLSAINVCVCALYVFSSPGASANGAARQVAEGLDFADDMGRGVLVTGLPYPALGDDKVKVKRAYLDERAAALGPAGTVAGEKPVSGNEWYSAQAWKAVNQAVGRVIRHRYAHRLSCCLAIVFGALEFGVLALGMRIHAPLTHLAGGTTQRLCCSTSASVRRRSPSCRAGCSRTSACTVSLPKLRSHLRAFSRRVRDAWRRPRPRTRSRRARTCPLPLHRARPP